MRVAARRDRARASVLDQRHRAVITVSYQLPYPIRAFELFVFSWFM